ncbi:hypothetical protein D3C78_1788520 [compost metagenome]
MKANEQLLPWAELRALLLRIDAACHHFDHEQLRRLLLEAPAAFTPTDGICDLVWKARGELKPDLIRSSATDIEFLNTEIHHPVH